ncbi:MAG: adenylyl-sulfate reductase subunit beta, partial [Syntrophobacteraceae bacterium]
KRFKFPIRTTAEGKAEPLAGFATGSDDIKSNVLCTEPASSGAAAIPTLKK